MKCTLTIEGTPAALASVLASLAGSAATVTVASGATADDDDENSTPANIAPGALDSTGLPWDERIHSPAKSTVKDGTWRKKKGADAATVAAVEAELRARVAASGPQMPMTMPQVASNPQPQMPMTMPQVQQPQMTMPQPAANPQPQMPQMPVNPEPTPQPQVRNLAEIKEFGPFMGLIQEGLQAGKMDAAYLDSLKERANAAYAPHNVRLNTLTEVSQHPYMIPWLVQVMQQDQRV